MFIDRIAAVALSCTAALPALAQPPVSPAQNLPPLATAPTARSFVSTGSGTFGTTQLTWRSEVEEIFVSGTGSTPGASIFTTSYVRTGKGASATRPVIFAFNGGPGASAIWLHLGFFGPRRIDMDDPANPQTTPPFRTIPNPDSPLDVADLMLIDPPGTGWSTVLPSGKPEHFYGVEQDAQAIVQVIREWLRRHGRLNAPKYLAGESYGTVRAAVVAKLLAGGPTETGEMTGITLNGVMMLGQIIDYSARGEGGDRGFVSILPTLAATACHFGKAAKDCTSEGQADAARRFIRERYVGALHAGSSLPDAERQSVAAELSNLTGLPVDSIIANDLRISGYYYARTLLAQNRKRLGMYDARYILPLGGDGGDPVADDPAMGQDVPSFIGAWSDYARDILKVQIDQSYQPISFRTINGRWDWGYGPGVPGGRNYGIDLAAAMTRNSKLRLMVATGWYDLVTPAGGAEYDIAHSGVPLAQTQFKYYQSGHMPYLGAEPRAVLARDIRAFVTAR